MDRHAWTESKSESAKRTGQRRRSTRPILPSASNQVTPGKRRTYRYREHAHASPTRLHEEAGNYVQGSRVRPRPQSARHLGHAREHPIVGSDRLPVRRPSSAAPGAQPFARPASRNISSAAPSQTAGRRTSATTTTTKPRASYSNWHRGFEADLEKFASVALLCRLKFDQAKVISGAWTGEPVRLRTAMALTCMERLGDSLPNEQRELMAELLDEVMRSVFCDIAKQDVSYEPVTGADVLDTDGYQTFFDRCKVLSREVNSLRAQVSQMQRDLKAAEKRPRGLSALRPLAPGSPADAESDQECELGAQLDPEECAENISAGFARLTAQDQQQVVTDLVLEMAERPSLSTALTVVNGMSASGRTELIKVLRADEENAMA